MSLLLGAVLVLLLLVAIPLFYIESFRGGRGGGRGGGHHEGSYHGGGHGDIYYGGGHGGHHGFYRGGYSYLGGGGSSGEWFPYTWFYPECNPEYPWSC